LLAQILAQQAGIAEAAGLHMQRIQRIAVHPQVQQQGVGATILRHLCQHYGKHKQTDWLGASFAAEPHVVRFWLASGYQPVWAGQRLDTATALPSLQVVLPISPAAQCCTKLLQAHFFHYYAGLQQAWQSPLATAILTLVRPTYAGIPNALVAKLLSQVGNAQGNVYAIRPYLYQHLLRIAKHSSKAQIWLAHSWQPSLSHKQFVALTRELVVEWQQQDKLDLSS
jgi:tRNA(Met) C34 N-acetyltransferase TmcA